MKLDSEDSLDLVKMDLELCSDLLGKPYQENGLGNPGWDCFTLAQAIYYRHGLSLPDLDYSFGTHEQNAAVESQRKYYQRLKSPEPFAIITIKYHPKYITHIGICVDHCRMLHAVDTKGVVLERFDTPWYKNKIEGYYKWIS